MSERLQTHSVASNWQFYDRAQPTTATTESVVNVAPNAYSELITKSEPNDIFDLKKSLLKVPKQHRAKAAELLREIEKHSPQIAFDSKGTIFIDGEAIPQSNFFVFFPLLFKKRVPKSVPGLSDFVTKLSSIGLKHLFLFDKDNKSKLYLDQKLEADLKHPTKNWWRLT